MIRVHFNILGKKFTHLLHTMIKFKDIHIFLELKLLLIMNETSLWHESMKTRKTVLPGEKLYRSELLSYRGYTFIWHHLRMQDVSCYWEKLLKSYADLVNYKPKRISEYAEIKRPRDEL